MHKGFTPMAHKKISILIVIALLSNAPIHAKDSIYYQTASNTFLFLAGAWLAHQQLPRLAGQKIEYDAPRFTKIGASTLFCIGIAAGIIGAYNLVFLMRENCNNLKQDPHDPSS
jgi:hypothetical protein